MSLKSFWHNVYIAPRRQALMRKWGLPVLEMIDRTMKEYGRHYSLVYGSLLGAVREKGFIPHDFDIDIALWSDEDYSGVMKALKTLGFTKVRQILVDGGAFGREDTWKCHHIYVDFFFFFPAGDGSYYGTEFYDWDGCRGWGESVAKHGGLRVLKILLPMSKDTENVPFENTHITVTKDALAFVREYYGPGWKVPDPTFVYPRKGETNYEELPDKIGILTRFK